MNADERRWKTDELSAFIGGPIVCLDFFGGIDRGRTYVSETCGSSAEIRSGCAVVCLDFFGGIDRGRTYASETCGSGAEIRGGCGLARRTTFWRSPEPSTRPCANCQTASASP